MMFAPKAINLWISGRSTWSLGGPQSKQGTWKDPSVLLVREYEIPNFNNVGMSQLEGNEFHLKTKRSDIFV
jgi:hypothetical protein